MSSALETRTHSRWLVGLLACTGAVAVTLAVALLADGMADLRGAYLYRESSGEGIALAQVAARLVAGGVLALAGVGALFAAGGRAVERARTVARGVAWATLALLAGCTVVAVWVAFQSGCIGPCG